MRYAFSVFRRTPAGIIKDTHIAASNHEAHRLRSSLCNTHEIAQVTPIIRVSDLPRAQTIGEGLPLFMGATIKKRR